MNMSDMCIIIMHNKNEYNFFLVYKMGWSLLCIYLRFISYLQFLNMHLVLSSRTFGSPPFYCIQCYIQCSNFWDIKQKWMSPGAIICTNIICYVGNVWYSVQCIHVILYLYVWLDDIHLSFILVRCKHNRTRYINIQDPSYAELVLKKFNAC